MSSKTLLELSKLSTNMSAFDLSMHEGEFDVAMRERTHVAFQRVANAAPARALLTPAEANYAEPNYLELLRGISRRGDSATQQGLFNQPLGGPLKRSFDVIVAGGALVLVAPLMLTVVLLIYATMGRPIFFTQKRVGFRGASFPCLKFRTMVTDADDRLRAYLQTDPAAAREWAARQKLAQDPRITRLGRLLRQSSLDELPQLFNVLKGDMSCVGPRPIVEPEIGRYGRYWKEYLKTRPGLTGIWQVSGRNRVDYKKRVALDRCYIRRWSFWRDLAIILRTIPAVMRFNDTA